jgi:hypothetical protein
MTTSDDGDEAVLMSLDGMPLASLREEWRRRWGARPIMRSVLILRHLIAWRIQAARHGGLTAMTAEG